MALNLTGIDESLYYSVNSAVNVGIFLFVVLPALLLCLLCVVALLFADSINWKIRVLIINTLAGEICLWLALTILFLGYPARQLVQNDFSCKLLLSMLFVTAMQKFMSTAFYAIAVYTFIKNGLGHLKWYLIIPYITISWMVSIAISSLAYVNGFSSFSDDVAFCDVSRAPLSIVPIATIQLIALIFLCIIIVFSLLTYCFVKKNTLEDNVDVKKAVSKILFFFFIAAVISFVGSIIPSSFAFIKVALREKILLRVVLFNYIFRLLLNLISIVTPIAMIIILKPLRLAIKKMFKRKCCVCRTNEDRGAESATQV